MNRAFKYRIYPNKEQEILIAKTFGCCRFVYNSTLAYRKTAYEERGETIGKFGCSYYMTNTLKAENEWLREVDKFALTNAVFDMDSAYQKFFKEHSGYPKFKSKRCSRQSYTTCITKNNIEVDFSGNRIKLPKLKWIKSKVHRKMPEYCHIKSATVSKEPSGKYYVSVLVEYEQEIPTIEIDFQKSLGLDYSSHDFYIDSNGNSAMYPRYYRKAQNRLAVEQRRLSKMVKGSNNYKKQKTVVARLSEHVANQRKDFAHKLSRKLANTYDIICVEDINLKAMAQSLKLGKSTNDNGFGAFREYLSYKLNEQGKHLIKIDKWFPSSKMCRFCGSVNKNLKLSERTWRCDCGMTLNRDENAAINILNEGIRILKEAL